MKYSARVIITCLLGLASIIFGIDSAQGQTNNDNGIIVTQKGDVTVFYDEFTGKYSIGVQDSTLFSALDQDSTNQSNSFIIPLFSGAVYGQEFTEFSWTDDWSSGLLILIIRENTESQFFDGQGRNHIRFLIDEKRVNKQADYRTSPSTEIIGLSFTSSEWDNIVKSESTRFRISGQVFTIDQNTKKLMEQILREHQRLQDEIDEDQRVGNNPDRSAPYYLEWEGELDRSPVIQPLPTNPTNEEATITIRFEVNPDGTLGRVIPLRKMNPDLEREVMIALRSWRFSRLPSGVPQESEWGTITFQFALE